jgi:hypothetical protein
MVSIALFIFNRANGYITTEFAADSPLEAGGKEIRTAGPTCDEDAGQNTFMRRSRTAPV